MKAVKTFLSGAKEKFMKRYTACGMIVLTTLFVMAVSAQAYTFDQVDTEFWVGSGVNEALLIVDYNGYGGDTDDTSFAFGFRWDGTADGLDLFEVLNADGRLTVTNYDTSDGCYYYQIGFEYEGYSYAWSGGAVPFRGGYSDDGEDWNSGSNGSFGNMRDGLDTIELVDGMWFGYSVSTPFAAPDVPQSPVPVPAAVWLLGSGLMGLAGMRRRKNSA